MNTLGFGTPQTQETLSGSALSGHSKVARALQEYVSQAGFPEFFPLMSSGCAHDTSSTHGNAVCKNSADGAARAKMLVSVGK